MEARPQVPKRSAPGDPPTGDGLVRSARWLLVLGILLSAALGEIVGAAKNGEGGFTNLSYIPRLLSFSDKGFNWFIFLMAAGPVLVAASVLYGAGKIVDAVRR